MKRKVTMSGLLVMTIVLLAGLLIGCMEEYPSFNISRQGYIISETTGVCLGTTAFELKGEIFKDERGELEYKGRMQVKAYPVSEERLKESGFYVTQENGYTYIVYGGAGFKSENQVLHPDISGYAYWFYINDSDPNDTIVFVTSWDNIDERYYVVPAASEAAALDKLNTYLKSVYGEEYPRIG